VREGLTEVALSIDRAVSGARPSLESAPRSGHRKWASKGRWGACLVLAWACQAEGPGRRASAEPGLQANLAAATPPSPAAAPSAAPVGPLERPSEPLSVILITLEALRADMPWSGYSRAIAPHLTQLAAEAGVWQHQHSLSSHTPQSIATLLSGHYPSALYRDGAFATSYAAHNEFFPELLQAKGIRTIGVQAHEFFRKGKGFEQGFDVWELVAGSEEAAAASESDDGASAAKSATRLIELLGQPQNTGGQFFAWAHFMGPHQPYVAHPEVGDFGKAPRDLYDSEVAFTDQWLGKLLEFARHQNWWKRTAVIVVGAHGEALGEHGASSSGGDLWEVLLRTPLLIRSPGATPVKIEPARSHLDLAPTIVALMGLEPPAAFAGQSLVAELYGAPAAPRAALLFELSEDTHNPGWRALIAGDDKLMVPGVANGAERLFNLKQDPAELVNVAEKQPEKLRQMAVRFEREFGRVPRIEPYGGMKLKSGRLAQGPENPGSGGAPTKH
jgi:choline-sulfatase